MQFIGLRHGESEFNLQGLCNDRPDRAVNLTAKGRRQAESSIAALRSHSVQRIITSELPRAVQTAELIAAGLHLAVKADHRLNDIRSGCDGHAVADYLAAIAADPLNTRIGDGETLLEFHLRINAFLSDLTATTQDTRGSTLLVTHEEALRVFKARGECLSPGAVVGLRFANCEPYRFAIKPDLAMGTSADGTASGSRRQCPGST